MVRTRGAEGDRRTLTIHHHEIFFTLTSECGVTVEAENEEGKTPITDVGSTRCH